MKRLASLASFALFASLLLSGCSALTADIKKIWDVSRQKPQDVVLTAEQIAELPYTAIYARVDGGTQVLIVLGFVNQTSAVERLTWVTGGRETLVTEHNRIISTAGLAVDLAGVSNLTADPLRCILTTVNASATNANCPTKWTRQIDIQPTYSHPNYKKSSEPRSTDTVVSRFTVIGPETVALPSGLTQVTRVQEQGQFMFTGQAFTNEFWLAADGHVVKSRQQLTANTKPIELTQVKWVGRND
ncbi:YjbF family lipoprotein [Aliidiomarina quisquiliarum]|uniref:YjbF family lipoprotein n=1 Tax=Aliidiomarina quisquiliarum TaxID=2938947 RepID=UPI00208F101D|nr:YjbF family lipoprotein [Aliidiomarina quisquiliarum]MCO4322409.1 YjbF family lipoprotein [Aliidiomarina quisquiliarum]